MKKPVTKCQKFFLEVLRSDKHGIRRGVLSQSRGRVLKKFSRGLAKPQLYFLSRNSNDEAYRSWMCTVLGSLDMETQFGVVKSSKVY